MSVTDKSSRYLRLAIENFERAEKAVTPTLKAKFRQLGTGIRRCV
jgi:hypothetical protein